MKQSSNQEAVASASTANDLVVFQINSKCSIFVRDLPFACTSEVLRDYCAEKLNVPIVKALVCENRKGRKLQFGCVLFKMEDHVQLAIGVLNNTRFQGRDIRVLRFDPAAPSETSSTGSIHVSFKTLVPKKQLTEEDLQKVFAQFGEVEHVSIRSLKFSNDGLQGGYGFLSFKNNAENQFAVEQCYQRVINDVIYDCQWSQKNSQSRESDRKIWGERINVQTFTSENDQGSQISNSPLSTSPKMEFKIKMPTGSTQILHQDDTSKSFGNKKSGLSDRKIGQFAGDNIPYTVSTNATINNISGHIFPNRSPNLSNVLTQTSPVSQQQYSPQEPQQTSPIPSMHVIPQYSSLHSPQQYYTANPLDTHHQNSSFLFSSHQYLGQSNFQQPQIPSNTLPHGNMMSFPPTNHLSMPVHNSIGTGMSQPLHSHISSDDQNAAYPGMVYCNPPPPPPFSITRPPPFNSDLQQQSRLIMPTGIPVNVSVPTYYASYYPVNTPLMYPSSLSPTLSTPNVPSTHFQQTNTQQHHAQSQQNPLPHHINNEQQSDRYR